MQKNQKLQIMRTSILHCLKKIVIFICSLFIVFPLVLQASPPDWTPLSNPAYNMDITANLSYQDGTISTNGNDLIAGFVGEECRGVASPLDFLDGAIFLTLGSQLASGETISFKAYLADLDSIVDLNETVSFENMSSIGTLEEPFLFTIDENIPPVYYEITASSSSNGSIDPEGVISVESGTDQSFLIVADDYHHILEVLIDGSSIGTPTDYTFYNIEAAHTIHANFAIDTYTLVYLAGSHGSLSGSVNQQVAHGSDGTAVTATPDAGYTFASWSDGSTENPRTDLNVTANIEVTANFGQNLYTISASATENGTIAPTGDITVAEGSDQNFQISPNTGYHIDYVSVDGSSVGSPATYTFEDITSNHTIHAAFAFNSYTLTYLAGDGGSLSGNTVQTIQYGGSGSAVLAVADAAYQFESWSDGSVSNPRTDDNITADLTVTANFTSMTGMPDWEPIPNLQYQMNVIAMVEVETGIFTANGNDILGAFSGTECRGIANPTGDIFFLSVASNLTSGETISFKAYLADLDSIVTLNETVQFANMAEIGTFNDPFILTIDDNIPPQYYTISASAGANGSMSPVGDVVVEELTDQVFNITADAFYHIEDVTVDGNSVGIVSDYTFTAVESDHSIHATFAIDTYTLTYLAGEHGSINGEAIQIVDHGSDGIAVTAVPDAGYTFASWSDGSTANPRVDQNVTTDLTLTANFGQNLYTIQASSDATGSINPSGEITVAEGSNQSFTITADEGYHIDDVSVDAVSAGAVSNYTFENIQEDHTIHASFEINSYTLTYEAGTGGSLQGETIQTVTHGSSGTAVLALAETGFTFDTWSDGITDNPRTDENVVADISVTANFSPTTGIPDWSPEPNLQYNMQVLAKLRIDETNYSTNTSDIVAAFVGQECRGLASPMDGDGVLFLTIGSNQGSGETITFKAYLSDDDEIVELNEEILFQNMAEIGSYADPFIFTIDDGIAPVYYTITASAESNGTINPSGDVLVQEGNSKSFIITAADNYQISDLLVDGSSVGIATTYTFDNVISNHTIQAYFESGSTDYFILTYIAGEGGTVEGDLYQEVAAGANGTSVTAVPNDYYQFVQWSDGITDNPRTDENVQGNITVTAQFESTSEIPDWIPPVNMQYNMSIVCQLQLEDGSYAVSEDILLAAFYNAQCRGVASPIAGLDGLIFLTVLSNQASGEIINFKAYLPDQNRIVDLSETVVFENLGEVGGFNNPFIFTIQPEVTHYEIDAAAGDNGNIVPSGLIAVEAGADQFFNFIPDNGYHIDEVIVDGNSIGQPSEYTFEQVNENHSILVNFAIDTFVITASATEGGSVSPAGESVVEYGTDLMIEISPDEGYVIEDVVVDGVSVGALTSYNFENITEDHTISASFELITYTITATSEGDGSIEPAGIIEVTHGSSQGFSFFPNEGYHIEDVLVDGQSIGQDATYTFENITEDHIIEAIFVINTYVVNLLAANDHGVVYGEGVYSHGTLVTVNAIPETGYAFSDWTENEQIVSEDTTFTFTIISDRELVANFVCIPEWDLQNNYEYAMQVVGQLTFDGIVSGNKNDKVGAFVGGECRGIASPSVDNDGLVFMSVASNFENGEVVTLKLWQSSTCSELVGYPGFIFENQALIGSIEDPYQIKNGKVQSLDFYQGYTWFSSNVNPGSMQPNELFYNLEPCANDRIIGQTDFALYYNDGWVGSLTTLDPKKMYRMKLCEAQFIEVVGDKVSIEPIDLTAGYTWVGFLPQECIPINEATANISPPPSPDDRITGQNKFALYTGSQWIGTITELCPSEGYVFKMAQPCTVLFPEESSDKSIQLSSQQFEFDEVSVQQNKAYTMMVVGEIIKEGEVLSNSNDRILAYINGECVGVAAPLPQFNNSFFLSIGSDQDQGVEVTFKVWLNEQQRFFEVQESFEFLSFGEIGTYKIPKHFHLKEITGINQETAKLFFVGNPYPNPFTSKTTIPYTLFAQNQVSMKLINSQGMIVQTIEAGTLNKGEYSFTIQKEKLKPGIYTILIQFSHHKDFHQVIKSIILY